MRGARDSEMNDGVRVLGSYNADVAELADALDLDSSARKGLWVRTPPSAPNH